MDYMLAADSWLTIVEHAEDEQKKQQETMAKMVFYHLIFRNHSNIA
jgi:hypothetical protein